MKETIFFIVMIVFSLSLSAQDNKEADQEKLKAKIAKGQAKAAAKGEVFPDYKLFEELGNEIGWDTKQVVSFTAAKQLNDETLIKSGLFILNKGAKYRFSIGNARESDGTISFEFFKDQTNIIEKIDIPPGEIKSFDFDCKETGRYRTKTSIPNKGKAAFVGAFYEVIQK